MKKRQRLVLLRLSSLIRPKHSLSYLLIFLLTSCGTWEEDRNAIFVHAENRQIKAKVSDREVETPQFVRIPKVRKHQILNGKIKTTYRCSFDFRNSLIPNTLLGIPNPIVGVIFQTVDYFTGGMFNCEEDVEIPLSEEQRMEAPEYKRRVLIFPPRIADPILRDKLISQWRKEIEAIKVTNYEVLDTKRSWEVLIENGINISKIQTPQEMSRNRLKELGLRLQFTHILYFDYEIRDDRYIFFPQLYSMVTNSTEDDAEILKVVELEDKQGTFYRYLWNTFNLLPNTLSLGADIQNVGPFDDVDDHPDDFPTYIRIISLGTTIDKKDYRNWDFGYFLAPAFYADSWRLINDLEDDQNSQINMDLQFYQFLYGITGFWKTPFSTIYLSYYAGLGFLEVEGRGVDEPVDKISFTRNLEFRWQFMFTRRFSVNVLIRNVYQNLGRFGPRSFSEYQTLGMNISYFFPEAQEMIKGWFR